MPSPFPGMDPYVERSDVWPELHNRLMVYACDALQPLLPAQYVARLELRVYVERDTNGGITTRVPDLELVHAGPRTGRGAGEHSDSEGPFARRGYWIEAAPVERREASISIRRLPGDQLVSSVELLSPSNQGAGPGRDEYLRKQREMLDGQVNLVEIDLLRGGLHTVAIELEQLSRLPRSDYLVCVYRSARPSGYWVDPWTVRQPLPPLIIPLAPEDPELTLDFQELFRRAYDNAAVPKLIDYTADPEPPLTAEDAAWADRLLREAKLRGEGGA
jgi:hypothetical protein